MKLGKLPHTPDSRDLRLADYLSPAQSASALPEAFGHGDLVRDGEWGMLGNDAVGDCVWAGAAHETMVLGREGGRHPEFTDAAVVGDYAKFTGYTPGDESTDRGTDVRQAALNRRKVGIADAGGHRHHIGAFLWLRPGDIDQLWQALYIFGVVGVGYEFPDSAMQQFNEGKPWDVISGARIEGGHYVPAIGRRSGGYVDAVSWGRRIGITPAFYERYCDSAVVYVSASALGPQGVTPEGLNKAALVADLAALRASGPALFPTERIRPLNPLRNPAAA